MTQEDTAWDVPTITLSDDAGRTLECFVEHSIEVEGQEYVLLHPVDSPVEIVTWNGEDDDEEATAVDSDQQIDRLFSTAKAVLAEENLKLKRTAIVLTVEGELPEEPADDEAWEGNGTGDDVEEFQWLASFFHEETEYAVYTPLDPFFIVARLNERGEPELLDPEELEQIEDLLPSIEEQLFDGLE
ncbi:MAG: DUF3727 domain-containing protein [Oscillatoriales cyanobacterium]|nr:MAG: DUF3727 domain-containing protein [Oscillatoriales cyanobacterium]